VEEGECQEDLCAPDMAVCVGDGIKVCKANGSGYGDTIPCPQGTMCQEGECVPVQICVPGESFCLSEMAFKVCLDTGDFWEVVECPANHFCVDEDGHAFCEEQCIPSCTLPLNHCGPDAEGCGTLCQTCQPGYVCPEGVMGLPPGEAVPCLEVCSCEGKECGDDGCGNFCGECEPGFICQSGQCIYLGYTCEEGFDCGLECNVIPNDQCVQACVAATSPEQQGQLVDLLECIESYCGDGLVPGCAQEIAQTACAEYLSICVSCQPDCFGKECGDDGCGGDCGLCPDGFTCQNYKCMGLGTCEDIVGCIENSNAPPEVTIPMCMSQAAPEAQAQFLQLATCVQDLCGEFDPWSECYFFAIQTECGDELQECMECLPSCTGKECGEDGCGGWCGFCPEGYDCDDGVCVCIPDCSGKECGPDGCGNLCGKCPPAFECMPWGKCECTPDCVAKECGDDGCGGTCGFCEPDDEFCTENGSCISIICQPGAMECDGNMLLVCSEVGMEWISLGLCEEGTYCLDGMCLPWVCVPGLTACDGNGVATCADNGAGWLPPELCPAGTKCQAGKCIPTTGCGDIPNVGCCDGSTFMLCGEEGVILVEECGNMGCGWIPNWGYGCGGQGEDPSGQFPLACPGTCQPECDGKECGSDGCGDVCGLCPPDFVCNDGTCEPFCIPSCQGKMCGDDGCQGVCGVCAADEVCWQGQCMVPPTCESMMNCASGCWFMGDSCYDSCTQGADQSAPYYAQFKEIWICVTDVCAPASNPGCFKSAMMGPCYQQYLACVSCQPSCDGAQCGPDGCGGICGVCPANHECVDGICEPVCLPDCVSENGEMKECGPNGCGGQCGVCKPGYECENGKCLYICKPQCVGKECGPDGCGDSCGFCAPTFECTDFGQCVPAAICGDGICEIEDGEDCGNCPGDCGNCSNGCEPTPFPGCGGCKCEECVCALDGYCCQVAWDDICVQECHECGGCCEPNCQGKECGPDGCGGTCGTCPPNHECGGWGQCEPVCIPDCDGKECGPDECGGTCG